MILPGFSFLPGLTKHSHRSFSWSLSKRTSAAPPPERSPIKRAGMTRELLKINKSPGFRKLGKFEKFSWERIPVFLSITINRESERVSRGVCAINSSGSS